MRERKFTLAIALVIIITIGTFAYFSERNEWEPSPHETSYMDYLPEVIASLPEDFYPAGHTRDDLLKVLPQAVEKTDAHGKRRRDVERICRKCGDSLG